MAEADFEIDFYGDATNDQSRDQDYDRQRENGNGYNDEGNGHDHDHNQDHDHDHDHDHDGEHVEENRPAGGRQGNESEAAPSQSQGVKRKSDDLDRPVDNGATSAIMVSELNWWMTDDDLRGWLRKADSEDELKELTFSEHKVNGKSKGQAFIEFESRQAATAAKRYIDQLSAESNQPGQKKTTTSYWNPNINPFKTLPKDAPMRSKEQQQQQQLPPQRVQTGSYNDRGNYGGGFRGRGGMIGGRGGMNPNFNRNFNNNMGFNNMGGGFQNPMGGGGGNFGGFNPRGGGMMGGGPMGGMRGGPGMRGRGGMMGMNPMGGMNMGMPGNMGMGMMGGGMPGFQGMNPNFGGGFGFGQNQGGNAGDWGNPHGSKRPRPE